MSRIVVGISGGVDSSVAAYLLKQAGHSVTGCRVRTFDTPESLEEEKASFRICEMLGIPLVVLDYRAEFRKEVIEYFAAEYAAGRTPNPCCVCNRTVKWQALLSCMHREGAEQVATGHYAVLEKKTEMTAEKNGETGRTAENTADAGQQSRAAEIKEKTGIRFSIRSAGTEKDQSYALYNLTQEELSHTVFPLTGYSKDEVRKIAAEAGLFTAEKPDSQEICFIPENDYAEFLHRECGITAEPGNFVDSQGRVLGHHQGIIHYTVGQRKGLGIALGKPVFVKEIRPRANEVVLADNAEVFTETAALEKVNFQAAVPFGTGERPQGILHAALARIRYADRGTPASLTACGNGRYLLRFERPVRAVTPGQAAVLYGEDGCILCGGTIAAPEAERNAPEPPGLISADCGCPE